MKRLLTVLFALVAIAALAKPAKGPVSRTREDLAARAAAATQRDANKVTVAYDTGKDEWMNIYPAEGVAGKENGAVGACEAQAARPGRDDHSPQTATCLTPVYIWAHPNSDGKTPPSANDIPANVVMDLNKAGVTVISWESVPQVKTLDDVLQCRADLEKVYKWLADSAAHYNIDMNNIFIGGSSRGTVVSWKFVCDHWDKIRGAYLTQALPVGAWLIDSMNPLTTITANNPPVVMSYRTDMNTDDGHNPKYGKMVADKYAELGIGERATVLLSQPNLYAKLLDFIDANKK